jgi:hypothetical protein
MALDLSPVEAKIRKFQKVKQMLSDPEIHEVLADPEMLAVIQQTIRGNGSLGALVEIQSQGSQAHHVELRPILREGTLLADIMNATLAMPKRFKVKDVLNHMKTTGYVFDAKKPDIAVNSALRKLAKRKYIRLITKGRGRNPHIFGHAKE